MAARLEQGRGLVLSDLHLFGLGSNGWDCLERVRGEFADLERLVLNGDAFDFRWDGPQGAQKNQRDAEEWLGGTLREFPRLRLDYVLGNHDCRTDFRSRLETLERAEPRLRVHERWLELGTALFLHGDCANWPMTLAGFDRMRARYAREAEFGALWRASCLLASRLGITERIHTLCFSRARTVGRIAHFLDDALPGWRGRIRDCYFGHTHLPFQGFEFQGVAFHNTGSGNPKLGFLPLHFFAP